MSSLWVWRMRLDSDRKNYHYDAVSNLILLTQSDGISNLKSQNIGGTSKKGMLNSPISMLIQIHPVQMSYPGTFASNRNKNKVICNPV